MDLRHNKPDAIRHQSPQERILVRLERLAPALKLAAIRDALPIAAENELASLHVDLILMISQIDRPVPNIFHTFFATLTATNEPIDRPDHIRRSAALLLAADWHRLQPTHRKLALNAPNADWNSALAELLSRDDLPSPASAALFVDLGPGAPPEALIRLIAAPDRDTADTAEKLLIERAFPLFTADPADLPPRLVRNDVDDQQHQQADQHHGAPTPADTAGLVAAMLDSQADHERSTPALVALAMLDRPAADEARNQLGVLNTILDNPDHPAAPVLRRLIRRDRSPMMRRLAWRLLPHPGLGMPALERVAHAGTPRDHEAVLEAAHLILHPARRRALTLLPTPREASARSVRTPTPIPADPSSLSTGARRGLARLAPALDVGPAVEADAVHLAALVEPDRLARLMHARVAAGGQLADFCFDPDPAIARSAVLRWSAAGTTTPGRAVSERRGRLASKLKRSPHPAVRRLMRDEPGAGPAPLDSARGRFLELLEAKPDRSLGDHLRDAWGRTADAERRVALLDLAARARVLDSWRDLLADLAAPGAADPRVAATVASVVRTLPEPFPRAILFGLLDHTDARVRANAVESLDRLLRRGVAPENARDAITEIKSSDGHRMRANAVRAETGRPSGGPLDSAGADLEQMLTDDRPPHRLAGAWLAERVLCAPGMDRGAPAWQRAALRVARVAKDEPDAHIRARAKRCARRLLAAVGGPTAPIGRPDPAERAARDAMERFAERSAAPERTERPDRSGTAQGANT